MFDVLHYIDTIFYRPIETKWHFVYDGRYSYARFDFVGRFLIFYIGICFI